jgi:hypothetical protein
VLNCTFAVAPGDATIVGLYARPLDIDGTLDSEVPEASRPTRYMGSFILNNVTTQQVMELVCYDVPRLAAYYLHNNGTGQSMPAGWTLKVTPRAFKVA